MDKGSVALVGAGCAKGHLTLEGLKRLENADAVVFDDLVDSSTLLYVKDGCELVYVGKRLGAHSTAQQQINEILLQKAKEGKNTVRLKGGDSFVFGRGAEEMLFLKEHGIACDVIPGVSSCIAVPESMGIPVTHRGLSRSFTVVTGHTADGDGENMKALAQLDGTLVFLMGLSRLDEIAKELIENGKSENTPCCILSGGFSKDAKRIDATLGTAAQKAKDAKTPAVIIVGEVCRFALNGDKRLPLSGVGVTVTGTKQFCKKLGGLLEEKGAAVSVLPCLEILPRKEKIPKTLDNISWLVFTSANAVTVFFENTTLDFRRFASVRFACIGKGTAKKLREYGFDCDFMPSVFTAQKLGEELSQVAKKNEKIVLLRAENGSKALCDALENAGMDFEDIHIYSTRARFFNRQALKCESDYIVFASAGAVRAFFENGGTLESAMAVCIGAVTKKQLEKYSDRAFLTADEHTAERIVQLIIGREENEKIQTASDK